MKRFNSIFSANWLVVAALILLWPAQWLVQDSGWLDSYIIRIIMLIGIRITAAVSLQLINGISGQFSLGHAAFMAIGAYFTAYPSLNYSHELTTPFPILAFYLAAILVIVLAGALLYGLFKLVMQTRRLHGSLPGGMALVLGLWLFIDKAMASGRESIPWYLPWSWSVNLLDGLYSGTLNQLLPIGQHLSIGLPPGVAHVLSYLILLLGGGVFAAGAGLLVGIPALRLRGDYLAIATLGFAEIVRTVIGNSDAMGGVQGLDQIPKVASFAWVYGIALLTVVCVWRLVHSARGRAMLAVREDEIAAAAVGIDPAHSKVLAFVVGAFFAGVAGAVFAHHEAYITPDSFNFMQSVELVVIVTLAGNGSITGTILMAAVLTWLPEQLRQFAEFRMVIYSSLLILIMLLRPNGILGNRELIPRRQAY